MSLPYTDPSLPSATAPIFGDIDAARGDHLRANNSLIWSNLNYLEDKIVNVIAPVGTEMLHINKSDSGLSVARFTNSATTTAASHGLEIGIDASEQGRIWNYENTDLILGTNNTARIYVKNDGKIGNINNPVGKFTLVSDNTYGDGSGFRLQSKNDGEENILWISVNTAGVYASIESYKIGTGVGVKPLYLNALGGYVGIGSPHASNPLHVQSTINPQVRIAYDANSYGTLGVSDGGGIALIAGESTGYIDLVPGASNPIIQIYNVSSSASLRILDTTLADYLSLNHDGTNGIINTNAGSITIPNTTASSSSTTGALIVGTGGNGGLGVAGAGYFGGLISSGASIAATTTITAGTGITATTGNIVATAGQVNAGTTITAGTGITATTGNIVATAGFLNSGKGKFVSGSFNATDPTQDNIFDALDAFIPNTNDEINLSGGRIDYLTSYLIFIFNKVIRTGANTMDIYQVYILGSSTTVGRTPLTITNGSPSVVTGEVSISW